MTKTKNCIIEVSTEKMTDAYYKWCAVPLVKNKHDFAKFWGYVGEHDFSNPGLWLLTPDGAHRIEYLLSPYATPIVLAWYRKNKQ